MDEVEKVKQRILELRNEGFSYSRIVEAIREEFEVTISKPTVIRWCKGITDPANKIKRVNLEPSQSLAYIIGVYFGGGSLDADEKYRYRIKLKVIDKEFAEAFSNALKDIGANPRLYFESSTGRWCVEATSKELYMFLSKPKEELFKIGEMFPREFIRGFFDSEGCFCFDKKANAGFLAMSNYDLDILEFIRGLLLTKFGIKGSINLTKRKGTSVNIKGKRYFYSSDLYELRISGIKDITEFYAKINITINRKRVLVEKYLKTKGYYQT
ncbi:LAGLIDADG family homing endonuclease [Pyrococcus abyssi]|uniref:LAGLIDADG family homing endonuclease n=1 Tax=Pyrococcus abyssi TaxID=29292 RepID=UPI001E43ACEE|nr:LAGLIDADG family homing endonuclease [Pyrococcus abyssi]